MISSFPDFKGKVQITAIKKQLKLDLSLYEILQILSVSVFDKTPLNQLLMSDRKQKTNKQRMQ